MPIPENMNFRWQVGNALTWITSNSDGIATETFLVPADKERFGRTTDPNPVLRQGAISSRIYCQLWEVHPRPEYKDQFRILQGHLMFAQFDVREKINSAACPYTSEEKRVAHDRLYRTTYPLQQIASMQTNGFAGGIVRGYSPRSKRTCPGGPSRKSFGDIGVSSLRENSELRDCLSALVRQLDWSLNSSYHPEPRPEANDGDQNSGVSDPLRSHLVRRAATVSRQPASIQFNRLVT